MSRFVSPAGFAAVLALGLIAAPTVVRSQAGKTPAPVLVIETAKGVIEVELSADAPKSIARVIELAKNGFYRGQRFHWVQPGVIQFGDPQSRDLTKARDWGSGGSGPRAGVRPVGVAELAKKPFPRGTVGLAYRVGSKPENADSQIFILTAANPNMVGKYAQIGKVTKGLNIADKIEVQDIIKNLTVR